MKLCRRRGPKGQPFHKSRTAAAGRQTVTIYSGQDPTVKNAKSPWATAAAMSAAALLLAAFFNSAVLAQPARAAGPVIVSLTFDDSHVDQVAAAAYMNSKGLHGTFYVPSGFLNSDPVYMNTAQALALQAAGNEIGGHTVTHPDLTLADTAEQQRQICNDRNSLSALGFRVSSFAYPFASSSPAIESLVAACGYNSARGLGDIASKDPASVGLPLAETIPPADPFLTKAPDQVDNTWTLQNLKDLTLKAEPGGGWMQYSFHHINVPGEPLSIPTADFNALIDFLAAEQTAGRVIVKTVDQVMGGALKALAANGPTPPAPITSGNLLRNPGFETAGSMVGGPPACWVPGSYGANTYTNSTVTTAHSGTAATRLVMSAYTSGDAKVLPPLDTGQCAPTVTAGHTYTMSAWFTSTAQTQFELYYRIGQGAWHYWTSSPFVLPAATYTQTTWTSPPVPAGATAMSMALTLSSLGTLVTDDYSLVDSSALAGPAAITAKAASVPSVGSALGSAVCGLAAGGCYQGFTGGQIHWSSAAGAHITRGAIDALWAAQNWEAGGMGYPLTDEIPGLKGGGVYQVFQGGQVHWSPTSGAHLTKGAVDRLWASLNWENGPLGYPTSNEIGIKNGGVYQNFQGGVIYWSAATGAHTNGGAIRAAYASQGWENGRLGYPTTNEYQAAGGAVAQDFQGGRITWTAGGGTRIQYTG
jgi:peptidoglycan/xylan/chitin deacetylase (PgdA/CDA1 family)